MLALSEVSFCELTFCETSHGEMDFGELSHNPPPPPTTPPIRTTPDITSILHTITTSPAEVESLLKQLNTKKSPGHDGIPTRLLKGAAAELAPSLAVLYNLSFQTGDIPQDWKDATVSPIHKKVPKPPQQTIAPSPSLA